MDSTLLADELGGNKKINIDFFNDKQANFLFWTQGMKCSFQS